MSAPFCLLVISAFAFLCLASQWQIAAADETLLVAVGGYNGSGVVADVSIYSLTTNSQKNNGAPTPKPLQLFGSAIFNDTIYIINGMDANEAAQNEFWAYNVAKDTWISNLPDVPAATVGSQAVEVGGRIYVLGGLTDLKQYTFNNQVFVYSTRLRKWYTLDTTIPQNDANPCAVVQEKHLYYLPAGALYHSDDGAATWETLAAPSVNRTGAACVAVGTDAILLMGGRNQLDIVSSAEIYNITTNTWKPVDDLKALKSAPAAVLIPGSNDQPQVLLCGGAVSDTKVSQFCETYDIQSDKWSPASYKLNEPRSDFGLFVLPPVQ